MVQCLSNQEFETVEPKSLKDKVLFTSEVLVFLSFKFHYYDKIKHKNTLDATAQLKIEISALFRVPRATNPDFTRARQSPPFPFIYARSSAIDNIKFSSFEK